MGRLLARRAWWLVFGLMSCEPAPEISDLPLALRQLSACPVGVPSALEIAALGDFPSQRVSISGAAPSTPFDTLPSGTQELSLRAQTALGQARGRRVLGFTRSADPMWLLPEGPSCPLADVLLRATDGAVVSALPGGGALIAGGSDGPTLASADAELLRDGSEIGAPVASGMLLRRAFASATVWRDQVIVAGGTPDRRGAAHDTYELFDIARERFDAARSGKLQQPRMQHAALLLGDELLLVGGRSEGSGAVLASAELLDLESGVSEELPAANGLRQPRAFPALLSLDSGSVLALGGEDEEGRALGSVERFDRTQRRFEALASELPVRAELAVAALPGARVAWLACDRGTGAPCELWLLAETASGLTRSRVELPFSELAPSGLSELSLLPLGAGRLLLTAADDGDPNSRRRAFSIDPAAPSLSRVDATRVPRKLLALASGAIAELDSEGLSLRAAASEGRYASPAGDLLETRPDLLAHSAAGHFTREPAGLRASAPDARLDIAELRFAAFNLQLSLQGEAELLFYDEDAAPGALQLTAAGIQAASCSASRRASGIVNLTRRGRILQIDGTACTLEVSARPLGMGIHMSEGALLEALRITRR